MPIPTRKHYRYVDPIAMTNELIRKGVDLKTVTLDEFKDLLTRAIRGESARGNLSNVTSYLHVSRAMLPGSGGHRQRRGSVRALVRPLHDNRAEVVRFEGLRAGDILEVQYMVDDVARATRWPTTSATCSSSARPSPSGAGTTR